MNMNALALVSFSEWRGAREVAVSGQRTAAVATSGVRGAQPAKVEAVVNGKPTAPAASPTPTQVGEFLLDSIPKDFDSAIGQRHFGRSLVAYLTYFTPNHETRWI